MFTSYKESGVLKTTCYIVSKFRKDPKVNNHHIKYSAFKRYFYLNLNWALFVKDTFFELNLLL